MDLESDPYNCGWCGSLCDYDEDCVEGRCTRVEEEACPPGQTHCYGICIDTLTDPGNCGDCDISCGADETCERGICTAA